MVAKTAFPSATTVASGMFSDPSTYGLVQGSAYPDPATRWALRTGILSQSETDPMYGGVLLYALVPGGAGSPLVALGSQVGRATNITGEGAEANAVGFSVFDQAYGMVQTPGNTPPLAGSGDQVMWYPLGSRARIVVAADPSLLSLQASGSIGSNAQALLAGSSYQCGWDLTNQLLIPASSAPSINVTSAAYDSVTGEVTLGLAAPSALQPGDSFTVADITGTGSYADANGTFTANPDTTPSSITYTIATGLTLTLTVVTPPIVSYGASNILPVALLDIQESNCLTVDYDIVTDTYQWNENGIAAVIQI